MVNIHLQRMNWVERKLLKRYKDLDHEAKELQDETQQLKTLLLVEEKGYNNIVSELKKQSFEIAKITQQWHQDL